MMGSDPTEVIMAKNLAGAVLKRAAKLPLALTKSNSKSIAAGDWEKVKLSTFLSELDAPAGGQTSEICPRLFPALVMNLGALAHTMWEVRREGVSVDLERRITGKLSALATDLTFKVKPLPDAEDGAGGSAKALRGQLLESLHRTASAVAMDDDPDGFVDNLAARLEVLTLPPHKPYEADPRSGGSHSVSHGGNRHSGGSGINSNVRQHRSNGSRQNGARNQGGKGSAGGNGGNSNGGNDRSRWAAHLAKLKVKFANDICPDGAGCTDQNSTHGCKYGLGH